MKRPVVASVRGRLAASAGRICEEPLARNHLAPRDVLAALVRSPGDPLAAVADLRAAGVRAVPVMGAVDPALPPGTCEVELHVRLPRSRRLSGLP